MNNIKLATYDGYKARLEDFPKEAWTQVLGVEDKKSEIVSTVRRCINFRANSIASIPWKVIYIGGDSLFDSTKPLENRYQWFSSIIKSIRRIEISLIYTSKAFYSIDEERVLDPRTITPKWDKDFGITHYERRIDGKKINIPREDLIYFADMGISETEPRESIMDVVRIDSAVIRSIDEYITQFFNGGTIKATIITTKENSFPTKEERDTVENFLNRSLRGLSNAFKSVFLRTPIEATVVGSGLEDFDPDLLNAKIMSIITAFEVPASSILPSAANYATAISDKRLFYESVGIDRINYIFDEINNQFLSDAGLQIVAEPEKLSVFQTDEHERSQSLMNLVNAGFNTLDAAMILGYDLDDDIKMRLESSELEMINRLESSFVFPNAGMNQSTEELQDSAKNYSIH